MTTIAFRKGMLAADTSQTTSGSMNGYIVKIARSPKGDLAGASGSASFNYAFLRWFENGENTAAQPKPTQDDHYMDRGVIFRQDGRIEIFEPIGKFECMAEYYAFGSGIDYALGAMYCGADAESAVRAAIAHDPNTGGDVLVLTFNGVHAPNE